MSRRYMALLISVPFGISLVACGAKSDSISEVSAARSVALKSKDNGGAGNQVSTTSIYMASTPDWTERRDDILAYKATMSSSPFKPENVVNSGPYAYLSEPIDITGPGEYTLIFNADGIQNLEMGYTFQVPDDTFAHFEVMPAANSKVEEVDGHIELRVMVTPPGPGAPVTEYPGFSVWIY